MEGARQRTIRCCYAVNHEDLEFNYRNVFKKPEDIIFNFPKRVKLGNIRCRVLDVAVLVGLEVEVAHGDHGDPCVVYESISGITSR